MFNYRAQTFQVLLLQPILSLEHSTMPQLDYFIRYSVLRNINSLSSPVQRTPPLHTHTHTHTHTHCAPGCLIHNSLSKVGRDVPALDKNKVSLPSPQFSLEVRRITFTSGLLSSLFCLEVEEERELLCVCVT